MKRPWLTLVNLAVTATAGVVLCGCTTIKPIKCGEVVTLSNPNRRTEKTAVKSDNLAHLSPAQQAAVRTRRNPSADWFASKLT